MDLPWYTGFMICPPYEYCRCRVVRGRRYRTGTPGGLSRQSFRRTFAAVHRYLAEIDAPTEAPVCRWANKSFVSGAMYLASVMASVVASALAYGFATAFAVLVAMFTWAAVGSFVLFPVDHARPQVVDVDTRPTVRIEPDVYCMGGRRRVPCRGKTHRRYGRRRDNRGYLQKQEKKQQGTFGKQKSSEFARGLASVRGGDDTAETEVCTVLQ